MKILLIYFTGTFNTAYISKKAAAKFTAKGHQVDLYAIEGDKPCPQPANYDLIGLGYPIHAFNEPRIFRHFVRGLDLTKGQRVFIYKTSGEVYHFNDASSRYTKKVLKRKKCLLVGEYHFVMPYNIVFRTPDPFVKEALNEDEKALKIMVNNLEKGTVRVKRPHLVDNLMSKLCLIEHSCGYWNSFLMKVDEKKCVKCQKCVKECPNGNIVVKNGRIVFKHQCLTCMRCAFYCPTNAIKMGLLENWKVNGAYRFEEIAKNDEIPAKLERKDAKKFYRCFDGYFDSIDKEYEEIKEEGI